MKVSSDSDDEVEIDPCWMDVKIDELQGLGNPMKVLLSNMDLMPDLMSMSDSEYSVVFLLTLLKVLVHLFFIIILLTDPCLHLSV